MNPLSDGNRIITEQGQERQEDTWAINQLANTFGLGTQSGHQYIDIKHKVAQYGIFFNSQQVLNLLISVPLLILVLEAQHS